MTACLNMAMAKTGNGALDWFDVPVMEMLLWADVLSEVLRKNVKRKK